MEDENGPAATQRQLSELTRTFLQEEAEAGRNPAEALDAAVRRAQREVARQADEGGRWTPTPKEGVYFVGRNDSAPWAGCIWEDPSGGAFKVSFDFRVTQCRVDLHAAQIEAVDRNHPLSASIVRRIPFGEMAKSARTFFADWHDATANSPSRSDETELASIRRSLTDLARAYRGQRGRVLDDDCLEEVAAVYRAALRRGEPPVMAVKEHFCISRSAAAKRVERARLRGHLSPTTQGRKGEVS